MSHREDTPPNRMPQQPAKVAVFPRPAAPSFEDDAYDNAYGHYDNETGGGAAGFDFWEALQIIAGRKFLIAAIVLLGMLMAAVMTLRSTPLYRAQATVEFQKTESQILEGASVDPAIVADAEYLATQFALLRSRSLAERVAEVLGLPSDESYADQELPRPQRLIQATNKILENLSIAPEGRSLIGRIQYVSDDPREAARVTNAIVDNFIQSTLERKYNSTLQARTFLEERIELTKSALEDSERRLVEYAAQQGIIELNEAESASSLDANSLIALNAELARSQSVRIDAEQIYLEARSNPSSRQLLESLDLQRLRAARSDLVAEYQERLGEFKPEYPSMVQLKSRIDTIEQEIEVVRQSIVSGLQGEFRAARATELSLQVRVNELKLDLQNLRNRRIEYTILRREVDTNRSQYEALLQRLKEIGIASSVGASQVSVVDIAQAPSLPFKPNLTRSLATAFVLSLLLAVGLAYALAYIDDTIKSPEDLRKKLGLPPIGVIPKAEEAVGNIVKALDDPKSGISEGFFSARTALQFSSPAGTPRSLLVTSTRPGEGKSSTSVSLATVIAKTGKRVLIVDADMRKPSFQTDGTESIGLSGMLTRGEEALRDHVIFAKPNLALLPSGMVPPNPAEILSSPRLAEVIKQAEDMFDVVVIDSPPILSFTDAPTLGAACEAAVVVIQAGQIRRPAAQRTVSRLLESRTNVIGGILTKFDSKKAGYDYGYYHYAYGKSAYAYGNERMSDSSRERRKINLFTDDDGEGTDDGAGKRLDRPDS